METDPMIPNPGQPEVGDPPGPELAPPPPQPEIQEPPPAPVEVPQPGFNRPQAPPPGPSPRGEGTTAALHRQGLR